MIDERDKAVFSGCICTDFDHGKSSEAVEVIRRMGEVHGVCGPSVVAVESREDPYEMEEPGERGR